MKQIHKPLRCHLAIALMAVAAALTAHGATPLLQGRLVPRALTPGEKTTYALPSSTEVSGGMSTVPIGAAVYLETEINIQIPATNIVSVTWSLTNLPPNSRAALAPSPLAANMPPYEPADRVIYQVADRQLLRPDVTGQYTVLATITTANYGSTNVALTLTVGTYMGKYTCELCHSGTPGIPAMVPAWEQTGHAQIFTEGIDGLLGHYSQSCLACHTVGYNVNTNAVNGGFDDIAKADGWVFPPVQTNGNFAAMPADLQNVANIQCENCHGPGSEHANAALRPPGSVPNWPRVEVTTLSGDCNQCHDAPTHHVKGTEWMASRHAITTRIPSGTANRAVCVGCHTSNGFIDRVARASGQLDPSTPTNVVYTAIGCQTCHEPHGITVPTNNPNLLRALGPVTMPDGTVVSNAGKGQLCLDCHVVRNGAVTNQLVNYPIGKPTWVGGSSFGVHDAPQGDMIEGINAVTYGQDIPSSAHRYAVTNLCVGCHMQSTAIGDPDFLKAGGHTFGMTYDVVSNGVTNEVDKTDVCTQCHGPIDDFNMVRGDLNGDGRIQGVQDEVQSLLDKLSTMLPSSAYVSNGNYVADGLVKTSVSFKTNWPAKFLKAGYNWQFVNNDGSKGVHNAPFAVGLLKASIGDLTGDVNNDSLPDWWQTQYFGSPYNPAAAPNYSATGDGVPNWLKYNLGLDPLVPGQTLTNGVVLGNVAALGETNTVHIFTAAEVVFDTEAGKTYQIQSISSLSQEWENVGAPIAGTGAAISYVTPTRPNVQQYYRVSHTP
jgi:hypothetical protein